MGIIILSIKKSLFFTENSPSSFFQKELLLTFPFINGEKNAGILQLLLQDLHKQSQDVLVLLLKNNPISLEIRFAILNNYLRLGNG